MTWSFPDAYAPDTLGFLRADPVTHTLLLGVLAQPTVPNSLWGELRDDAGQVLGAAWCTPPWGLGVTEVPYEAALALAAEVAVRAGAGQPGLVNLAAVVGPRPTATLVAGRLAHLTGGTLAGSRDETLYRIDGPAEIVPDPRARPSGAARPATEDDLPLLTDWWLAFVAEAGTVAPPDPPARVRQAVADRALHVWDRDGVLAMAGARHTGGGVARIGPVYTPPAYRGAGLATVLTEHAVRALFTAGAAVVTLFADDANRTSSGIYRRIGFRPVLSWADVHLRG
ncbi:MAG TPA: GNAT family N-acetyltransferase [Mycobacteriales bacterium]